MYFLSSECFVSVWCLSLISNASIARRLSTRVFNQKFIHHVYLLILFYVHIGCIVTFFICPSLALENRWMHISLDSGYALTLMFLNSLAVPHYRWSRQDIGSKLWGWIEADYQAPPKGIHNVAPPSPFPFCHAWACEIIVAVSSNCFVQSIFLTRVGWLNQKTPSKKDFNNLKFTNIIYFLP